MLLLRLLRDACPASAENPRGSTLFITTSTYKFRTSVQQCIHQHSRLHCIELSEPLLRIHLSSFQHVGNQNLQRLLSNSQGQDRPHHRSADPSASPAFVLTARRWFVGHWARRNEAGCQVRRQGCRRRRQSFATRGAEPQHTLRLYRRYVLEFRHRPIRSCAEAARESGPRLRQRRYDLPRPEPPELHLTHSDVQALHPEPRFSRTR